MIQFNSKKKLKVYPLNFEKVFDNNNNSTLLQTELQKLYLIMSLPKTTKWL